MYQFCKLGIFNDCFFYFMTFTRDEAYTGSQAGQIRNKLKEILSRTEFRIIRSIAAGADYLSLPGMDKENDFIYRDAASGSVITASGRTVTLRNFNPEELADIFASLTSDILPPEMRSLPLFLGISSFDDASGDPFWKELPWSEWYIPANLKIRTEHELTEVHITLQAENGGTDQEGFAEFINPLPSEEMFFPEKELAEWSEKVEFIKDQIVHGSVSKVVLARRITGLLPQPSAPEEVFTEMMTENPHDTGYFYRSMDAVFMGATPEKLLSVKDGQIYTEAIAGSIKRNGIYNEQEMSEVLSTSEKDLDEHILVRDFLLDNLRAFSSEIQYDKTPTIKKLRNLFHLKTMIAGSMKSPGLSSALRLVSRIFPTPAVCGTPKEKAAEIIREIEAAPRGYYAGIMGYFTLNGNCDFAVTIRSILLRGNVFAAYAGCGIVKNSDPVMEFEESTVKLKTATAHLLYANQS